MLDNPLRTEVSMRGRDLPLWRIKEDQEGVVWLV